MDFTTIPKVKKYNITIKCDGVSRTVKNASQKDIFVIANNLNRVSREWEITDTDTDDDLIHGDFMGVLITSEELGLLNDNGTWICLRSVSGILLDWVVEKAVD